ncbi:MAG: LLM class flavin-dependent oxidoreductase, partial [Actinobacteria bacterium]|nr:LLM class flavin-dependent oxidoreductase [Actinomycetota bacterium]
MELDLLYEIDAPKPWPDGQAATEREAFMECIEQVKLADKVGFRTVWCVEHHFREQRSHMSAPEVVIGALSQVTENIHLGFGVMLMP